MSWTDYLDDIEEFINALQRCEPTEETAHSLRRIYSHIRSSWINGGRASSGDSGIPIPPPRLKGLHPRMCKLKGAELRFVFELGTNFDETAMPKQADFQVKVEGYLETENSLVELEDHWRVDTHMHDLDAPREPHPYFHFQRGGHAQDSFADDFRFLPSENMPDNDDALWKALMQSSSPRIPMIPYCPIMAIDFAINQHNGDVWRLLVRNSRYVDVLRRAQDRLWTPFFAALARPEIRRQWLGPVFV